ncbi:hypothetical protein CPB84DRAFT_936216 [Gymnopilus junonius]|uniref:Uncharacterized protein n=1 Tax=Gymnopilus junonius TaxID=109634 RepID=A0A9P5P0M3_GYMJU|nr:hypothetical protein CPB84DRAFT_936216 [Gymnopilus junonius]
MLELSSKWSMAQIKALAIQKLIPLTTAVEKIALAKKHNLSSADPEHAEWLVPAYTELCARRSPLTLEEAEDMDLPTIIKVWEVQNAIVGLDCMYSNYGEKVTELVKEKFGFRGAAGMPGTTISGFWSSCS